MRAHYGNENSSLIIKGLKSENNYPFYNSDAPFGDNKSQKRENNQLAQYSSYAYYRQKLSSTKYLDYSLLYSDKDKNQPTRQNFTNNQANLKNKIAIGSSLFSMPMFDGDFSIRTSILNRSEHFNDNLGLIGISQVKNQFDRNNRFEVAAGYNNYIGDLSTTWVNRASLEKYDSHDRTGRILRSQWQRTELASALSSLWEINPKWQSEATLAIEYYKDQQQNSNQPKQSDSLFSGHISVQYLPDYSNQLFANISQSHRLPGQRELFGNLGYSIANPDLQPEKAINSEIGWKYDVDNITISSSLFARSITNLITTIYDSRGIGRSENIAKADINGIELMLDYQWKQWQLNSSTTRQNSKQNSFFVAFDGKQLPGLFTFQQVLSAKYSIDNWGAGLSYQFSDGLFHNRAELAEATSNLELWSASASYTFGKYAIRTSLLNLLDKEYVLFNRYTAPGLELRITWNYQL